MASQAGWSDQALAHELRRVAQALVAGRLKDEPRWGLSVKEATIIPTLVATLRAEQFPAAPLAALKSVLEEAITNLGGQVCPGTNLIMQDAARLLFGFDAFTQPVENGNTYNAIVRYLRQQAGILKTEERRKRDLTDTIRQQVARNILQLIEQAERARTYSQQGQTGGDTAVARAALEQAALDALRKARKPVILWGESGNGKSHLARRLAAVHFADERVAVIRGPSGPKAPFMESDIVAALRSINVTERFMSEIQLRVAFREALRNPQSFGLVIFDNADEWMIDALVEGAVVPVIVTTTQHIQRSWADAIRVGAFSGEEAAAFCRAALPNVTDQAAQALCGYLGNRPVALMLASRLVQLGEITIEELLLATRDAPAVTVEASMDLVAAPDTRSLTVVYSRVVAALASDMLALEVLDGLLWLTGSTNRDMIIAYLAEASLSEAEVLAVRAAFLRLERIGLVELQGDDVEVNDLTIDFLRVERSDSLREVLRRFHQSIIEPAIAIINWTSMDETDDDTLEFQLEEQLEAMFPNPYGNRYSGHRWLVAWEVGILRRALQEFAPGMEVGLTLLSTSRWLLWQRGFPWFMAENGESQVVLADVQPTGMKLWREKKPSRFDKEALLLLYIMVKFYQWVVSEAVTQFLVEDASGPEHDGLPDFLISVDEDVSHRGLTVGPEAIAAEFRLPIWAACGVRYIPRVIPPDEPQLPPCGRCAATPEPVNDVEAWIDRFVTLNFLMQRSGDAAHWALIVTVATTMALLKDSPKAIGWYERAVVAARSAPQEDRQLAETFLVYILYCRQPDLLSEGYMKQATDDLNAFKGLVEENSKGPAAAARLLYRLSLCNQHFGLHEQALDLAKEALAALPLDWLRSDLQAAIADLIVELTRRVENT